MITSTILLGAGVILALVGVWLAATHFANRPPRHARIDRTAEENAAGSLLQGANVGVALMCAGGGVFLVGAYHLI